MNDLDCRVPQAFYPTNGNNVVSGAFAAPGQLDWAFLCSVAGRSSIHVVWGGPARCPSALATSPDAIYFQDIGAKQPEYSRSISRASPALIRERLAAYGHDTIQEISHDGINDAFLEKASSVHYCEAGAWRRLDGAD